MFHNTVALSNFYKAVLVKGFVNTFAGGQPDDFSKEKSPR